MNMMSMNVDFDFDIDVHDGLINVLEYPKEYYELWVKKVFATIRDGAIMCEMKLDDDVTEDNHEFAITDATGKKFVILCCFYLDLNYGYNHDPLYDEVAVYCFQFDKRWSYQKTREEFMKQFYDKERNITHLKDCCS